MFVGREVELSVRPLETLVMGRALDLALSHTPHDPRCARAYGGPMSLVIGVLASHDDRGRAETLAEDLPRALREHVDRATDWRAEVCETDPADASAQPSELTEAVRRHLLDSGWQMGIGLTALPLRVDRRPVATTASASHGVGLVSIPALGAIGVEERLHDAAVEPSRPRRR